MLITTAKPEEVAEDKTIWTKQPEIDIFVIPTLYDETSSQ